MAVKTKPAASRNGEQELPPVENVAVVIPKIMPKILEVEIVGVTPLLVSNWSTKALTEIADKQQKKAKSAKAAKDPAADYLASRYISVEGWDGLPAGGIKGCIVNACRAVDGLPMTLAKRMIFVESDGVTDRGQPLVRIIGNHEMHGPHPVRIPSGADIRYRAIYRDWSIRLRIQFLANVVSAEQVLNLIELAGFVEGLCEWRPGAPKNNTGDCGRFHIKRDEA
jgi:hypothetical protein